MPLTFEWPETLHPDYRPSIMRHVQEDIAADGDDYGSLLCPQYHVVWTRKGDRVTVEDVRRRPDPLDVMDARERIAEYREATQKW